MMRAIAPLLFGFLVFCSTLPIASAHTLEIDGEIGVTLHVHPDDEPVVGNATPFYIDIEQRNKEFKLINCNCQLSIKKDNQELAVLPVKYLVNPEFTFPQVGLYTATISGRPIGAADFEPFTANFHYYVRPNASSPLSKPSATSLQRFFPYVTLTVALGILLILLLPLNLQKGKK